MDSTARRRRRVTRWTGVVVAFATVATVLGSAAPSSAQTIEPIEGSGEEIPPEEVPLDVVPVEAQALLDCSNMTADAQAHAAENGYCDDTRRLTPAEAASLGNDATVDGPVAPQDIRWGNCGSSHIFVWRRGGGYAGVGWGFFSILGTVIRRNLTVRWLNYTRDTDGRYVDSSVMFSQAYSRSRSFYTRTGEVIVWMTGNVRLLWGGSCTILMPVDSERIT